MLGTLVLSANGCGIDRLVCGFVKPSTKSTTQARLPIPLAGSPSLILLGHTPCQHVGLSGRHSGERDVLGALVLSANDCGIDKPVCGFVKPSTKSTAQAGLPIPLAGSPSLILLGHAPCQHVGLSDRHSGELDVLGTLVLGANDCGIDKPVCGFVKPSTKSTAQAGLPIPLAGSPSLILLGHAPCQHVGLSDRHSGELDVLGTLVLGANDCGMDRPVCGFVKPSTKSTAQVCLFHWLAHLI